MRALTEGTGRDLVPVLIGTLPAEYDAEPPELVERAQHDLRRRDARHHRRSSASEAAHRIESANRRSTENARQRSAPDRWTKRTRSQDAVGDVSAWCVWRCRCLAGVQACVPLKHRGGVTWSVSI